MSKREDNFKNFYEDLDGENPENLITNNDPFIEDLRIPKNKRDGFVGALKVEIPVQKPVQKQIQTQTQILHQNNEKVNPTKRNLKNNAKTSNNNFRRNIRRAIAIATLAALVTTGIIVGAKNHKDNMKKIHSQDIQSQIEQQVAEKITSDDLVFDGENFNASLKSDRTEVYKVLASSDLDESLNQYYENSTVENRSKLENRKEEIAKLNFQLVKASLADSLDCSIDDIKITLTNTVLNISTPKGSVQCWSQGGKYNYNQIPYEHAIKITAIAEAYEDTKGTSNLNLDELLDQHSYLKEILGKYNFTITDHTLYLQGVEDSKTYTYSEGVFGNPKFKEIKEKEEQGR